MKKNWADSLPRISPFGYLCSRLTKTDNQIMSKSTHFLGQPILGQLLNYLNKAKILQISRDDGGERYVKKFNAWCHLTVMLYAVISRFDSLREITSATMMECRKLQHLGIKDLPRRSTLSDANSRRDEGIFGKIYMDLYQTYKGRLSSDSPSHKVPKWMKRLQIIDSTTVSLFSNLIFKGVGRNPKTGKKGGTTRLIISGRVPGRHQGTLRHPCQRGRSLRHPVHFSRQA
jgi:hypothetical protein